MAKKRRHKAGHMRPNGRGGWRFYVSNGFDAKGERIQPTKTFYGSEAQAAVALAKFVADVKREEYEKPQKMICRDLFQKWLDTYGKFNLKSSTYETFERYLMKRVAPTFFGTLQVKKLSSSDFYELYKELREKYDYSNKTLLQIHRILHSAFSNAMSWRELQFKQHPMVGVKAPVPKKKKIVRIKEEEATHFLRTALKHAPFWFFVYLCVVFTSGLRRSEVLGLRKMDILADQNKLSVWQNVVRVKGKGLVLETPKSGEPRITPIPRDVVPLLQIYIKKLEEEKGPLEESALIFPAHDGRPRDPSATSRYMKKFREEHNLPNVTIHGGRHSFASILINKGVSLKELSELLGHSTSQITDITYTEVWEEKKNAVMDKLEGMVPDLEQKDEPPRKDNIIPFPRKRAK
jgi:integrase